MIAGRRRRSAGQRAAGRRHLPVRHRAVGEAQHLGTWSRSWEPDICIQCGNCVMVCPHAVIRARYYDESALAGAPAGFASAPLAGRGFPNLRFTLQVAVEDCTGCELCVEACPARSLEAAGVRAINMAAKAPLLERERGNLAFFLTLPDNRPDGVDASLVAASSTCTPLFEFSGACAGCGETPYLQAADAALRRPRCSWPTRPAARPSTAAICRPRRGRSNAEGRGPAWANSLFEDNAEFGLGYRLSLDKQREQAEELLRALAPQIGDDLRARASSTRDQMTQDDIDAQRERVADLEARAGRPRRPRAATSCARWPTHLVQQERLDRRRRRLGVRHRLRRARSRAGIGPQRQHPGAGHRGLLEHRRPGVEGDAARRASPSSRPAASSGRKKDLGLMAMPYGNVYVAQIAMGAQRRSRR